MSSEGRSRRCLVAPECPACSHRKTKIRFNPDKDIGVIRCADCEEPMMMVSILANEHLTTIKDPMADDLPEDTLKQLREYDRLPPAAEGVDIDVE